jgi:hypothetical protein
MKLFRVMEEGRVVRLSPEPVAEDEFSASCTIDEIKCDVPEVRGEIKHWSGSDGESYPHLHYVCPRCSREQNVDLCIAESNPRFACCDSCGWDSVVLIRWEPTSDHFGAS